jgi:hypothetical protein
MVHAHRGNTVLLRCLQDILGYRLRAIDDDIARVEDVYIDDYIWAVRHLVANTGESRLAASVLISPAELGQPDGKDRIIPVQLTVEEIRQSPDIHADLPVTLQRLKSDGASDHTFPVWSAEDGVQINGDSFLRSLTGIVGYTIRARDGDIGHVEDFVADTDDWRIRYMIADTRDWLPGKKILVSTEWITSVNFVYSRVNVDLTQEELKNKPEFDARAPANCEEGVGFFDYLGRRVE